MSSWIEVEQSEVNKPQNKDFRGVTVSVKLSEFDIPERARSSFDSDSGTLEVEFDYAAGVAEDRRSLPSGQKGVGFIVGSKSQRLYKVSFEASEYANPAEDEINLKLEFQLDAVEKSLSNFTASELREQSAEAAQSVIHYYAEELIGEEARNFAVAAR